MEPEGGSTLDEDGLEAVYIVCISKLAKGKKKKIFPLLTATSLVETWDTVLSTITRGETEVPGKLLPSQVSTYI